MKNMRIENCIQGSQEWHALRANHFTASDAAAMMGESKYKSRNQLLEEKATGKTPEVSEAKQRIFDQGHEAEAAARDILEMETLESYPPLVATREIEGLPLLASFDGCSLGSRGLWEHKLWNETLAENVRNKTLEPAYYWQLEHQLLVAGDEAQHVIFTVSDGTMEKRETMVYESVPERRKKLIAGWKQFAEDLKNYKPKAKPEQVEGADADGFPLVEYEVHGTAIYSNLRDILPIVKERAEEEMARPLETDQDFADKEKQVKAVKAARKHLKETTEDVKGEFVSFAEFSSLAAEMDSVLQKLQSHGEKAVKDAKAQKKREIEQSADEALREHIASVNEKIAPLHIENIIDIIPDWGTAMKNKRTLESLQNAVDEELSRVQVGIKQTFKLVWENLEYFNSQKDYHFLFNDLERIVNQQSEGFKALVQQRIADYEAEQKEKREREERERKEREAAEVKRREEAEARRKEREEADAKCREEDRAQEVKTEPEEAHEASATNAQTPAEVPIPEKVSTGEAYTLIDEIEAWAQRHQLEPSSLRELFQIIRRHYAKEAA
jgi:putative phage-type endonuclease